MVVIMNAPKRYRTFSNHQRKHDRVRFENPENPSRDPIGHVVRNWDDDGVVYESVVDFSANGPTGGLLRPVLPDEDVP